TGYRFYGAGQLSRLNRIVALKNLGFTLRQVASILDDHVSPAELIAVRPSGRPGFGVVDLDEIPAAAALIHHGPMDGVLSSIQALARWIDASGFQSLGYAREVTLRLAEGPDDWVTELQEPIAPRQAA
ncbi:MAG: MerR family transcriptional regulator, partial [Streptosporangiaceae bacterium]